MFLQSYLSVMDFHYDPNGGLMSSRIYFGVSSLEVANVEELAAKLLEVP